MSLLPIVEFNCFLFMYLNLLNEVFQEEIIICMRTKMLNYDIVLQKQ